MFVTERKNLVRSYPVVVQNERKADGLKRTREFIAAKNVGQEAGESEEKTAKYRLVTRCCLMARSES